MAAIGQQDYEAVLSCIARLHDCNQLEQFPHVALAEIPKLVGADHITFNYLAPSVPKVVVFGKPDITGSQHAERERVFARYLSDQPILRHYLSTGDTSAHKLSDFLSAREYHALPLYQHLYHDLNYEDQFAFMFFPPGSEMISIALARDRRTFTERDRKILNLLRPHVAQAYRDAEKRTLLNRTLRQGEPAHPDTRVTAIQLDEQYRPVQFGEEAQQWINRFFPGRSRNGSHLPERVMEWLQHRGEAPIGQRNSPRCRETLLQRLGGQRLRIRLFPGSSGTGHLLVLELETMPFVVRSAMASFLTRREVDVLLQVEQGKTNAETAAALGISALTVRAHLEHIFEKLCVPSRTAAVTQFRRLCSRVVTLIGAALVQAAGICENGQTLAMLAA